MAFDLYLSIDGFKGPFSTDFATSLYQLSRFEFDWEVFEAEEAEAESFAPLFIELADTDETALAFAERALGGEVISELEVFIGTRAGPLDLVSKALAFTDVTVTGISTGPGQGPRLSFDYASVTAVSNRFALGSPDLLASETIAEALDPGQSVEPPAPADLLPKTASSGAPRSSQLFLLGPADGTSYSSLLPEGSLGLESFRLTFAETGDGDAIEAAPVLIDAAGKSASIAALLERFLPGGDAQAGAPLLRIVQPVDTKDSVDDSDEVFSGGRGRDTIVGNGGDDEIDGGSGRDVLDGGSRMDTLTGGPGNDTLTGEGGGATSSSSVRVKPRTR